MSPPPPGPAMMTNSTGFDGCHAASAVGRERRTVPGPRTPRKSPTISGESHRFFLYMGCPPVQKCEGDGPIVLIGHRRHWGRCFRMILISETPFRQEVDTSPESDPVRRVGQGSLGKPGLAREMTGEPQVEVARGHSRWPRAPRYAQLLEASSASDVASAFLMSSPIFMQTAPA